MLLLLAFLVFLGVSECQVISTNIIGGNDAEEGEFPYIVSIRGADLQHYCGGSILDNRHILTAAHCVQDTDIPSEMTVQYGTNKLSADDRNIAWVQSFIHHPQFNSTDKHHPLLNDVAVITLKGKGIPYSKLAQPVKLPKSNSITPLVYAKLAGWGDTISGEISGANYLQKVDLEIFNDTNCEHSYDKLDFAPWTPYQICAGTSDNREGSCMGDSGGPLTIGGVQYGIVSWGSAPLCAIGYPGVYTRVTNYVEWILSQIKTYKLC